MSFESLKQVIGKKLTDSVRSIGRNVVGAFARATAPSYGAYAVAA